VVDDAEDQNDGEEELGWRCGFESECSGGSLSLAGALEGLTDSRAALRSPRSAAASAQLSVPCKYASLLKPAALCGHWFLLTALQDQGLMLYGGFFNW